MFDFVRTHSRLMLGLMVLLIFPSFVFFGIQGYSRFTDEAAAEVAKVDGREINRSRVGRRAPAPGRAAAAADARCRPQAVRHPRVQAPDAGRLMRERVLRPRPTASCTCSPATTG
jgi:peptidyl-prolyl cis-trans isomerase D